MSVLVAANDSPHGLTALRNGIDEARRHSVPLTLLMLDPITALPQSFTDALSSAPDLAADLSVRFRRSDAEEPADVILDTADEVGATLIVIGTNKRSGQGIYLMGATTQRVLLDASAPVLVVKAEYAEADPA